MASHSHLSNAVYFFKIILQSSLGKLKVPNNFIRKYGGSMSNPVLLKPPDESQWTIHWTKDDDGGVWFEQGWKEFGSYYCLNLGHLVLFKYGKGASHLEVNIFDKSCLEIEYPPHGNLEQNNNDDSDSDSVEFLNEVPPLPKQKKRSREAERASNMQIIHHGEGIKLEKSTKLKEGTKNYRKCKAVKGEEKPLTCAEKAKAIERVSTFMSKNPFFKIAIQPAYIRSCLSVPANFVEQHLKKKMKKGGGAAILRVSDGRTWHAKYRVCEITKKPKVKISSGWYSFAKDNHLKVGDVCVFELTNNVDISFLVHVFGDSKNSSCSQ